MKLTPGYPFQLFYWDYVIGIALGSLAWGFTLGKPGWRRALFFEQYRSGRLASDGICYRPCGFPQANSCHVPVLLAWAGIDRDRTRGDQVSKPDCYAEAHCCRRQHQSRSRRAS